VRASVGDIELAYDRAGTGDPVLLVMGLSATRIGWINQMPVLAASYDVVAFDNRGVGESSCPDEPWTIEQMADDAVGLMDVLAWDRAHVAGISMGGMISQEIALRHPNRVRSLTLMATHHGGPTALPPSPHVIEMMMTGFAEPEQRIRNGVLVAFGDQYRREHPEMIEAAIAYSLENPPPVQGLINQTMAVMQWPGTADRLGEITAPTLVMHGTADELIPVENGRRLAERIPGVRLQIYENAGHALVQERADDVNAALLAHLAAARVA
jgi:pimeloyl-ACP methyl ester carboxylesterase